MRLAKAGLLFGRSCLVTLGCLVAGSLDAATTLFDFEVESELAALRWGARGQSQVERATRFATSGGSSLRFATPAYRAGAPEWPSFELRPPVADWTGYDRLVVDVTHPGAERPFFALLVTDSQRRVQEGLSYEFKVRPHGYQRFVVPLTTFPKAVNRADIRTLHFFTERPATDLVLHLDQIVLLKTGEALPEPGRAFAAQVAALALDQVVVSERMLAEFGAWAASPALSDVVRASAEAHLAPQRARIRAIRAELASSPAGLAPLETINLELDALPARLTRAKSILAFQQGCRDVGQPATDLLVGWVPATEKVLPREGPLDLQPARAIEVSLARNEKESIQIAVLAATGALRRVTVRASDLVSAGGAVLPRGRIQCEVVGYVETKAKPPYAVSHVGWWPDPILDFLGPVDVRAGDVQTFWVRVRAPKDQPAGAYRGQLTVSAEGVGPTVLDLSVRVRAFTLPDSTPLPTAMTFIPPEFAESIPNVVCGGPTNWQRLKFVWADFLADYYVDFDSLYRHGPPDFEVLRHRHDRGTLTAFNFGYFSADSAKNLARFRPVYEQAQRLGLLNHAYIYGFDECHAEQFPALEAAARDLKRAFPEVPVMTTSYDHSYGLESVVRSVDAWCPLSSVYKPEQAARARQAGRQVWWYICCGPHHPYANWFIEYPGIEIRLLMGAMAARYRPDGFLYYSLAFWNDNRPITTGPFTSWNPVSWTTYHGDGSVLCAGPGGRPLPTIRLENYRDGQEDYAYAVLLAELIRQREAPGVSLDPGQQAWLQDAKAALPVPEAVVKSMKEYTRDAAKLYAWRDRIGELVESAGLPHVNPWGEGFDVRGFRALKGAGGDPAAAPGRAPAERGGMDLLSTQGPEGEFPGWKSFHERAGTRTAEVWKLQPDGVLVCTGQPRGYLYTEKTYTDFRITFEWRWPPGATQSNGGMLIRMTGAHGIWPKCLEFQLNMGQAGDFWGIGGYAFSGPAERLKTIPQSDFGTLRHLKRTVGAEKPVGEWNHFEGMVEGGTVTQKINGQVVNQATQCDVVPGRILFTAEGQEIQFRNVRLLPQR